MKKIYITLLFLGTLTLTQAQENTNGKSHTGIKGGYNLSSVSYNGEGETDQRNGFHVGIYGESFLSDVLSLQPELLFSQQGYEINSSSGKFTQKLNYINLPLMVKLYPVQNFFLEVGPQIGVAITHKEVYDGLFNSSQEFNPDSFDWGMNFGAGIKTNSGISLGVRYHLGIGDLYDEQKAQNRVWIFSVGFDF